jgi:hypothetical protein
MLLLVAAAAASFAMADRFSLSPPAVAAPLSLSSAALPLDIKNLAQNHIGALVYRGGLVLRSANKDFGGISGMAVRADGAVLAVSDAGSWISFALIEKKERLIGVTGIAIAPILDRDGKPGTKINRDAEALDVSVDGKRVSVAFEGDHRLWVYEGIDPRQPETFAMSALIEHRKAGMMFWPGNGGAEAQCSFGNAEAQLLISEEAPGPENSNDAYLTRKDEEVRFGFRPEPGFKTTDCVSIASGLQALVLQRHFSPFTGVAASITLADFSDVKNGAVIGGAEIARLAPPLSVDNMEAIAYVERDTHRYIYIMSDDNFSGLQRTLLMKFEWMKD